MPNTLAALSDNLMTATVLIYSLAMLGYAVEFAFGRVRGEETVTASAESAKPGRVLVGAGAATRSTASHGHGDTGSVNGEQARMDSAATGGLSSGTSTGTAVTAGRAATVLTLFGWLAHGGTILARGLAADRLPWGNMYEFIAMLTFAAVTAYLAVHLRQNIRSLGLFIMLPVMLGLGMAITVLYEPVGPLVPALHSYWMAIHVTAMVTAAGAFTVATVATALYLTSDRYEKRRGAGAKIGLSGIAARLPDKMNLDRIAHSAIILGFIIFTFGNIAGAMWGEAAWGRYWGWDPKETWSFITWVIYAGYLHARATAGWKGRPAAIIALLAFAALMFNVFGVNIWISGLHSYA